MPEGRRLLTRLVLRIVPAQLIMIAVLFLSAGTLEFWPGWAYIGLFLASTVFHVVYLQRLDPQLLERRLLNREKIGRQKTIMRLMKLVFGLILVLCGLDHRFGWSRSFWGPVPWWLMLVSLALIAGCQHVFLRVLVANRFAASIIQVEAGQTIADTGPYRWVRHPMYSAGIVQSLCTPAALGSLVVLPAGMLVIAILVCRLLNEENVLRRDLPGYAGYCQRTRYRLIPYIW